MTHKEQVNLFFDCEFIHHNDFEIFVNNINRFIEIQTQTLDKKSKVKFFLDNKTIKKRFLEQNIHLAVDKLS